MNAEKLINELSELTQNNKKAVENFKKLTDIQLNFKPAPDSWSILECIEHLNRYGNFYLPEISKSLEKSTYKKSEIFKSGFLGNYFAKSMLPKEKLNKMKTFKSMNPNNSDLNRSVLDTFINQQETTLQLLKKAKHTNLTKIKTGISITQWLKIRLGDTFRVLVYHNIRHIQQAKKVLDKVIN